MYLLDTNALNLVVASEENTLRQVRKYSNRIFISSVTAEEWLVSYMGSINRARRPRTSLSLPQAHEDFSKALEDLRVFTVFVFSAEADALYRTFTPATLRIGAQDCRIAAQALAHQMTVVTRNVRDFDAIGAPCEDWSASS